MWPFGKKDPLLTSGVDAWEREQNEDDLSDPLNWNRAASKGDAEFEKKMKSTNFEAFEDDEAGGYFGTEFAVRTTAARIKSTYSREPWVYASSSLVSRTLMAVPMRVRNKQTKEPVKNSPIEMLINEGGKRPMSSPLHMRWTSNLDLVLSGNTFWIFDESYQQVITIPTELVTLNFHRTEPRIESITVARSSDTSIKNTTIAWERVIHIMLPNPFNPFFGMSVYAAAARPILLDRYQAEFEMAYYLRGATNSGVIETQQDIGKTRMERLLRTFESAFTGKRNWWRTLFLPKGAKWVNASLSMKEMTHLEVKQDNRKVILAVLNIPPSMLGLIEDVNRATSEQQNRQFWENTIVPYAMFGASCWNNSYFMRVKNPNLEIYPDFSGIEALQGSTVSKGEQSKAMEQTHWIDEIRKRVWGDEPLPNQAGQRFYSEVRAVVGIGSDGTSLSVITGTNTQPQLPPASNPSEQPLSAEEQMKIENEAKAVAFKAKKDRYIASQDRIERQLSESYKPIVDKAIERMFKTAIDAIKNKRDVQAAIDSLAVERMADYWADAEALINKAMERGFLLSVSETKDASLVTRTKEVEGKFEGFSDLDMQAIEILRDKTRDGKRQILAKRGLLRFKGFDKTQTERIMQYIEDGVKNGQSMADIARSIREDLGEEYKNQARTIVRTEILSAVSEGLEWNGDVLQEVFTEVEKQWIGSGKPTSREEHNALEAQGPIPANESWQSELGGTLRFPRDPDAGAADVINCGCGMAYVIPDGARSNASAIVETES